MKWPEAVKGRDGVGTKVIWDTNRKESQKENINLGAKVEDNKTSQM